MSYRFWPGVVVDNVFQHRKKKEPGFSRTPDNEVVRFAPRGVETGRSSLVDFCGAA